EADVRAERKPTCRPARCAHTMAIPSRMPKALLSVPSACTTTRPSVSTPSTSNSSSLMRAAFASIDKGQGPNPRDLEHLCAPQVVQVHDAGDAARLFVDD